MKLTLDLAIGETSSIESTDKGKLSEIAQKIRDLNGRLQDIRREQVFQRVSGSFEGPRSRGGNANGVDAGTRSRIQRSVRVYECEGGEMDTAPADRAGRHLCLAAIAPSRVLHQAEAHLRLHSSVSELSWW